MLNFCQKVRISSLYFTNPQSTQYIETLFGIVSPAECIRTGFVGYIVVTGIFSFRTVYLTGCPAPTWTLFMRIQKFAGILQTTIPLPSSLPGTHGKIVFFQGTVFFFNVRMDKSIDLNMTSPALFKSQSFSKRRTDHFVKLYKTPQLLMNSVCRQRTSFFQNEILIFWQKLCETLQLFMISVCRQGKNCFLNHIEKTQLQYELGFFNAPNRL
jgi:hypothetical protein